MITYLLFSSPKRGALDSLVFPKVAAPSSQSF